MPKLFFFAPSEFREWDGLISPRLLVLLDVFRFQWNDAVTISPVAGAIGRKKDSSSQHSHTRWGEVRAIDFFPEGLLRRADADRAVEIMRDIGFTGIGIYPDARPSIMLHGDVREDTLPGHPATWGAVRNDDDGWDYIQLADAMERIG